MYKAFEFLAGIGTDHRGRTVCDYLNFSDGELEEHHDYIQWAFPTKTVSQFNSQAPILTDQEINKIRTHWCPHSQTLKAIVNYIELLERIKQFYRNTYFWRKQSFDHNHLRITRIIESTQLILGVEVSNNFFQMIMDLNHETGSLISGDSIKYWQMALNNQSCQTQLVDSHLLMVLSEFFMGEHKREPSVIEDWLMQGGDNPDEFCKKVSKILE